MGQIKEVHELKRSICSQSTFEIGVQDVDNEAKDDDNSQTKTNKLDINQFMNVRSLRQNKRSIIVEEPATNFASRIDETGQENDPSLHRNVISVQRELNNITLNEELPQRQTEYNFIDELPELPNQELARLGMFDGEHGSKIYEALQNRKSFAESSPVLLTVDNFDSNILPNQELELPYLPAIQEIPQDLMIDLLPVEPSIQQESIQPPQPQEPNLPAIQEIPQDLMAQQTEVIAQNPNAKESTEEGRYESFRQAVERGDRLLEKNRRRIPKRKIQAQKPPETDNELALKLHKLRVNVTAKKKLRKRTRARAVKSVKPFNMGLDLLVDDLSFYIANFLPFDEDMAPTDENQEEQPQQQHQSLLIEPASFNHDLQRRQTYDVHPKTSTPMIQGSKRLNLSPEMSQAKRMRQDNLEILQQSSIRLESANVHSRAEVPEFPSLPQAGNNVQEIAMITPDVTATNMQNRNQSFPVVIAETNEISPIPIDLHVRPDFVDISRIEKLTRVRGPILNQRKQLSIGESLLGAYMTESEREAAKTSHLSVVSFEQVRNAPASLVEERAIIQESGILQPSINENSNQLRRPIDKKRRATKARIDRTNDENLLQMFDNEGVNYYICDENGKQSKYTQDQMDILALYLQVRLVMKRIKGGGQWKMSVNELMKWCKMVGSEDKHAIHSRLWILAKRRVLIGTWSHDFQRLLEIEIPLNRRETSSEKEN